MLMDRSRIGIIAIVLLILIGSFIVFKPILGGVTAGFLLAYICLPLSRLTAKYTRSKFLAGLIPVILLIPTLMIGYVVLTEMIQSIVAMLSTPEFSSLLSWLENLISDFLSKFGVEARIDISKLVSEAVSKLSLESFISYIGRAANFFIEIFVAASTSYYVIVDGDSAYRKVRNIFSRENRWIFDLFSSKIKVFLDGFLYGYVVTALFQGVSSALLYYITGFEYWIALSFYTFLFGVLPILGAPLIYIPAAIYRAYHGMYLQSLIILVYGTIFLVIIPTFLLFPKLTGEKEKVHPLLLLIGIIGGPMVFGTIGLIVGPFLLSLVSLSLEIIPEIKLESKTKP